MNVEIGQRFRRLEVISDSYIREVGTNRTRSVTCVCDCGEKRDISIYSLINGKSKSCGCLQKELLSKRIIKHGMTHTRDYNGWMIMKARCSNHDHPRFKSYGGRGIKVCDRWLESFENFYEDVGKKPEGMSLERIDNNGNYEPSNCKWATNTEQANNRRTNIFLTYKGKKKSIKQWSLDFGIDYLVIYKRVARGWSVEDAIHQPLGSRML
jgi:hypothetical protein